MRMFSSSANCVRMPPAALLVEPGRERVPLEQHDVVDAEPAQVEGGGGAEGAATDHYDVCRVSGSAQELAERLPVAGRSARPLDHSLLLDREVVRPRRLDIDARVDERVLRRVHVVQRLHQARPCRVLACVLKCIHERPRHAHPVDDVSVAPREACRERWCVLIYDRLCELDARQGSPASSSSWCTPTR